MDRSRLAQLSRSQGSRLLREHLAKLREHPERFAQTYTFSQDSAVHPALRAAWEAFKNAHAARVLRMTRGGLDTPADCSLLGVPLHSSAEEIRHAFLRRAKCTHPDHGGSAEEFRELLAAYQRLTGGRG